MPYRPLVLLVEDDADVRRAFARCCWRAEMSVVAAASGADAIRSVAVGPPDIILLELMLPDIRGEEVLRRLHSGGWRLPIVALSTDASIERKAAMLQMGAQDYLTKPVETKELVARIRAVLARTVRLDTIYRAGICLDPRGHTVTYGNQSVAVAPRVFVTLLHLLSRIGDVVPWRELGAEVWQYAPDAQTNTMQMHVSRLRTALGAIGAPLEIRCIRGHGILLERLPTRPPPEGPVGMYGWSVETTPTLSSCSND